MFNTLIGAVLMITASTPLQTSPFIPKETPAIFEEEKLPQSRQERRKCKAKNRKVRIS